MVFVPPVRDGRSTRWDDHRAQRRTELIAAAVAAIEEHGLTTTIDQIAAAAGVARPALYRHFEDRADLELAIGHHAAQELITKLAPHLQPEQSLRAFSTATTGVFMQWVAERPNLARYCLQRFVSPGAVIGGLRQAVLESIEPVMAGIFQQIGGPVDTVPPLTAALIGTCEATAIRWLDDPEPETLPCISDLLQAWLVDLAIGTLTRAGVPFDADTPLLPPSS